MPFGLFRLIAGEVSVRNFKKNSVVIDDPRLSQLLAEPPNPSIQGILFETRTSPYVLSPATTGIVKQVLWLPMDWSEWTDLELRGILAHEVAHIRNRDHLAQLLAKMPSLFRHPSQPLDSTTTDYVVLVGEETVFQPNKPSKISEITDGTSTTLLVVEAKSNIPWTKPEDIPCVPNGPLPKLGGFTDVGFNAARADGSVLFVEKSIDAAVLRAMITPRGGEWIGSR